ncbi:SDR family NAD(P)-dependent oxidoreductase [Haematospirillum sp. H4485]|nr:SDR family NAD(P)-dependent oxidoreductase [Haematospirillum sp. H4485]NKD55167.1 SDR family NAD(P)-dependent oxidoreductase [Haematospirillum sp. H4890]NKD75052.1 SDR family NAD(P)-dependent oxidoreductase [Haematospirillum sp. H4485]
MEMLRREELQVAMPPGSDIEVGRVLVATDSAEAAEAAYAMGAAVLRLDQMSDKADMQAVLERVGVGRDIVAVMSGRDRPMASLNRESWMSCSRYSLEFLRWIFAQNLAVHIVSFHTQQDVLSALFEGLARSACLEMPRCVLTSVRIPSGPLGAGLPDCLSAALSLPGKRLRFGEEGLFRELWVAAGPGTDGAMPLHDGDTVVLIGGAGGVGRELIRVLQSACRLNVVVLGRKVPDAALIQMLKVCGARCYLRVDATDHGALDSAFVHIQKEFGPIKAVFNLAGILDDCLFHNLNVERLHRTLFAKVEVALNLAALQQSYQPRYVVNFSSLTATVGNVGQCAYGAANEFVERASEQFPNWYSFAWGLWRSQGMQMPLDGSGLIPMDPQTACRRMLSALVAEERHLVIYDGEVDSLAVLRGDVAVPERGSEPDGVACVPLVDMDRGKLVERTRRWLKGIVCRHSGLKTLKDDENMLDRGLDSVASIQISTDVAAQLSSRGTFKLSRAILFECPTIAQLADYVLERAGSQLHACLPDADGVTAEPASGRQHTGQSWMNVLHAAPATDIDAIDRSRTRDKDPAREAEADLAAAVYRDDDIAIVGMAGEFPNGATIDAFWRSLADGKDAIRVIPRERWDWRQDYSASVGQAGTAYGRHGGFIEGFAEFDPAFFNIAPVDAEVIDPQERRFLHVSYHALEDAGYFISPGRDVGVFVAAMFGHYQDLDAPGRVVDSSFAAIANRVSYAFDLQGPSLAIDTMCSGSLTALHMACNSLRLGECRMALAGGVNIMAHPGKYRLLSQGRFLSPSGRCHAFGVDADGYVPGEGVAVVVLKSVADAIRDQDIPYAIIRATAINSGGRTSSFTVPSVRAQQHVIQEALRKSGVEPACVNYVEAHGTGTGLGDPIELQALQGAYGEGKEVPCYLGSVKSNIGHLESAAAMAGLFKVVQQFSHGQLAPTLHCTIENPYLDIEQTRFRLVREKQPWPLVGGVTRFAGLSSFGAGGSNGHAILQQYLPGGATVTAPMQAEYLIVLSAPNRSGLRRVKQQLAAYLRTRDHVCLYSLSYTLCCARQHHVERECHVVGSVPALIDRLERGHASMDDIPAGTMFAPFMRAYLQGDATDFTDCFPVKSLLRGLPGYPFARDVYWAPTLKADPRPTPVIPAAHDHASLPSVLLAPLWQRHAVPTSLRRVTSVVVLASPEQSLPHMIGNVKVLRINPGAMLCFGHNEVTLRPDNPEDLARALDYITQEQHQEEIHWINFNVAWSDAKALHLAKALQACLRPCVILNVNDPVQSPENIAMGGVFRVLALENTDICYRQVQLAKPASDLDMEDWRWLLTELAGAGEDSREVEYREGERRERALHPVELTRGVRLRQGGVYLISGGMGMIGREIACRLYADYNARVVLVGRSSLSQEREAWLEQWPGGAVSYQQADIADPIQAQRVVTGVLQEFGCLNGVIQSAGVLRDTQVQNKSLADFSAVMSAKVEGTRQLDRCTAHLDLDFFCLFSSMSSIMGNVGQCDYVAANRFLDAFAAERNRKVRQGARKGHTLSINWPLWIDDQDSENRMEQYQALADYLRRHYGFVPLTLSRGAELFITWINGVPDHHDQVMGLVGDHNKIRRHFALSPVDLSDDPPVVHDPGHTHGHDRVAASGVQLQEGLIHLVKALTQLPEEDIGIDRSWGDLGLNSVMIQTLAQGTGKIFGVQVPPNALFTYGNIHCLAEYLHQQGAVPVVSGDSVQPVPDRASPSIVQKATHMERVPATLVSIRDSRSPAEGRFAIVGMSGIMPGAADLDSFWDLLIENRSAIRRVERWGDTPCHAGTIDRITHFDARFFGLSAREAMLMDPQHRLFLQTSYNALADAGYKPAALSRVGVFAGVQFNDYQTLLQSWGQSSHPYAATGNAHAMLANRVSYLFDFNGPSQTIDTACSSALVAVNRGVMALQGNECDMALVGAVSLLIDPAVSDAAQSMGVLSPDWRCATFDESANGYVRAEGVGCVVIKRLADAQRDADSIYGVIEASAENHGGRANSLTAPNPQAQAVLLQTAYTPELADRVSYIETHGTGTQLGDPIEIDALHQAFHSLAPNRAEGSIALGAVKSNIGHLEPAAGMASLLKVLLCLKHRQLPANIHFSRLNPMIHLDDGPFYVLSAESRLGDICSKSGGHQFIRFWWFQRPCHYIRRAERICGPTREKALLAGNVERAYSLFSGRDACTASGLPSRLRS